MSRDKFTLVHIDNGTFWTGRTWSEEYPDAREITGEERALREARRTGQPVEVIGDYGLDSEYTLDFVG